MKLLLYDVDYNNETDWGESEVLGIECESPAYFAALVAQCKGVGDGHIAVIEREELLDWSKDAACIVDFYTLDALQKNAFAKYCKQLDVACRGEEWTPLLSDVERAVAALLRQMDDGDLQWHYDVPRVISAYLKLCGAHVANSTGSVAEEMCNLCTLMATTNTYRVCVLVNAKSFFSHLELDEILKCCVYNGQRILLIDNRQTKNLQFNEKKIVVDEDFYDIIVSV